MKKTFVAFCLVVLILTAGIVSIAQAPTKLFDVRNGNGIIDNGVTQPQAWAEFRPPGRDSLCPSGAAFVSTMPAPSGFPEVGRLRKSRGEI